MARITRPDLVVARILLVSFIGVGMSSAQTSFTNITDSVPVPLDFASWSASWVDYDADGREDLFISRSSGGGLLLRNTGSGFELAMDTGMEGAPGMTGHTWGDMDNDGDLDVFTAGSESVLFRNEGSGQFTSVDTGEIGDRSGNAGWSASWGDYDADGFLDLIVANPIGFVGSHPNRLFLSDGGTGFSSVSMGPIVQGTDTYTIPTWADYDRDGDIDLFIGSGPANGTRDTNHLYRNLLTETGDAEFETISGINIAEDEGDGQVMNWVDIDNDGDFDLCVTNYFGRGDESPSENPDGLGLAPDLYRNNGDGSFTSLSRKLAARDGGSSGQDLANVWGDLDNDGDLDVLIVTARVTAGSGQERLYYNRGDGNFVGSVTGELVSTRSTSAGGAFGDYDDDGDLDVIVTGISPNTPLNRIFRNDLESTNGWLKLRLVGTMSNRSAIGAVVTAAASIGGQDVLMTRHVSAQNTFGGQNSLTVHFGLGDADSVDELTVHWPSGHVDRVEGVVRNQSVTMTENGPFPGEVVETAAEAATDRPSEFQLGGTFPQPASSRIQFSFDLPWPAVVGVEVFDTLGRLVFAGPERPTDAGSDRSIDLETGSMTSGVYFYRLTAAYGDGTQTLTGSLVVRH